MAINQTGGGDTSRLSYTYYSRYRPWWFGVGKRINEALPDDAEFAMMADADLPSGMLAGVATSCPLDAELVAQWELEEVA